MTYRAGDAFVHEIALLEYVFEFLGDTSKRDGHPGLALAEKCWYPVTSKFSSGSGSAWKSVEGIGCFHSNYRHDCRTELGMTLDMGIFSSYLSVKNPNVQTKIQFIKNSNTVTVDHNSFSGLPFISPL